MLLFNHKKEFIGIDEKDLQSLGFTSLTQLQAEADDFADMFVKKPGFIHNFKHVNWIDFVECADSLDNAKVIINANSKNFQCFMSVETIYLSSEPSSKAFLVNLHHIKELSENETEYISVDLLQKSTPKASIPVFTPEAIAPIVETFEKVEETPVISQAPVEDMSLPLDLDFSDDTKELELDLKIDLEDTNQETFDNGYIFDPLIASSELGLPVELIEEFIEDFIAQAKEFKDELYQAHDNGDKDNLKILSHKLKGVAANLRIEDALESLTHINTSDDNDKVKTELDTLYKIIAKLSGDTIAVTKEEKEIVLPVTQAEAEIKIDPIEPVVTPDETISLDLDDLDLDFKDDLDIFAAPVNDIKDDEIQEEVKLEITDQEVPSHISMPELADDDFSPFLEDETPELEDEIFSTPTIIYSKESIANEIGLDQESFNELFDDYLIEAKELSTSISTAIQTENSATWKHLAIQLKGMSDNMRIQDFTSELESLIESPDTQVADKANKQIIQCIKQLSQTKE